MYAWVAIDIWWCVATIKDKCELLGLGFAHADSGIIAKCMFCTLMISVLIHTEISSPLHCS